MSTTTLGRVIEKLAGRYGPALHRYPVEPFELVLWESVAYLADDDRKREALDLLRRSVGTAPSDILRASDAALLGVTGHGILPETFAAKLRASAEIAIDHFDGDLSVVIAGPLAAAKRALRRFPGIGEPGADKILLFTRKHATLAPESNALRVLVRLGLCPDGRSYPATYSSARDLARDQLGDDFDTLLAARFYLVQLGREICRQKAPSCDMCPLRSDCAYAAGGKRIIPME